MNNNRCYEYLQGTKKFQREVKKLIEYEFGAVEPRTNRNWKNKPITSQVLFRFINHRPLRNDRFGYIENTVLWLNPSSTWGRTNGGFALIRKNRNRNRVGNVQVHIFERLPFVNAAKVLETTSDKTSARSVNNSYDPDHWWIDFKQKNIENKLIILDVSLIKCIRRTINTALQFTQKL